MKVTQLHTLINAVTQEILGETAVVAEDLSNVVDIGKQVIDSDNVDNYVKKLVNHIGKVVFVTANNAATGVLLADGMIQFVSGDWSTATSITGDASGATANISIFFYTFSIIISYCEWQLHLNTKNIQQILFK